MRPDDTHEPFALTWTGIAIQIFVLLMLLVLLIARWTR